MSAWATHILWLFLVFLLLGIVPACLCIVVAAVLGLSIVAAVAAGRGCVLATGVVGLAAAAIIVVAVCCWLLGLLCAGRREQAGEEAAEPEQRALRLLLLLDVAERCHRALRNCELEWASLAADLAKSRQAVEADGRRRGRDGPTRNPTDDRATGWGQEIRISTVTENYTC